MFLEYFEINSTLFAFLATFQVYLLLVFKPLTNITKRHYLYRYGQTTKTKNENMDSWQDQK